MVVALTNAQREASVRPRRLTRVARCAIRRLRIHTPGTLAITLIDGRQMRALNKRFCQHDRPTDVLSFRYDGQPTCLPRHLAPREQVVGEIFIAPSQARTYAKRHGLAYDEELSRYVIHGLLHWIGHDDHTPEDRRMMRAMENQLLEHCGVT